jgi:hypothetical protein
MVRKRILSAEVNKGWGNGIIAKNGRAGLLDKGLDWRLAMRKIWPGDRDSQDVDLPVSPKGIQFCA